MLQNYILDVIQVISISMLLRRDENSDSSPTLIFAKTRSSSKGGSTVVQDGDNTGAIMFFGGDGNDADAQTAYILSSVDGTMAIMICRDV